MVKDDTQQVNIFVHALVLRQDLTPLARLLALRLSVADGPVSFRDLEIYLRPHPPFYARASASELFREGLAEPVDIDPRVGPRAARWVRRDRDD